MAQAKPIKYGATGAALGGQYGGGYGALIGGLAGFGYGLLTDDEGDQMTSDAKQAAFDQNYETLGQTSNAMDARRRAALAQAWGQYQPVDSVISRMYGPGAVGPGLDIDALFGPSNGYGNSNPMTPERRELQRGTGSYWDPARDELQRKRISTVDRNLERSELNKNSTFKRGTRIKR